MFFKGQGTGFVLGATTFVGGEGIAAMDMIPQMKGTSGMTSGQGMVVGGTVASLGVGMMLAFK